MRGCLTGSVAWVQGLLAQHGTKRGGRVEEGAQAHAGSTIDLKFPQRLLELGGKRGELGVQRRSEPGDGRSAG